MSKLLTVFGATGNQGGSVVKHVLAHPELSKIYKIRAVTRDASKPAAVALKNQGAEVVTANLDDSKSVSEAIKGSSAVFGITDFWAKMSEDVEIAQGKAIADASKAAGVEHLIWSSLAHISKTSNGAITTVKHFDTKATVEEYVRKIGVPASFFMPGVFMSAFYDLPRPNEEGVYTLAMPFDPKKSQIPMIDAASDSGAFVAAMLQDGPTGKRVAAAAAVYTGEEFAQEYTKGTGRKAIAIEIPEATFKSYLPGAIAEEFAGNMKLLREKWGYYLGVGETKAVVKEGQQLLEKYGGAKLTGFAEFAKRKSDA